MDHSIDITDFSPELFPEFNVPDEAAKNSKEKGEEDKIDKPAIKRAQDMVNFIRQIMEDILYNGVFAGR